MTSPTWRSFPERVTRAMSSAHLTMRCVLASAASVIGLLAVCAVAWSDGEAPVPPPTKLGALIDACEKDLAGRGRPADPPVTRPEEPKPPVGEVRRPDKPIEGGKVDGVRGKDLEARKIAASILDGDHTEEQLVKLREALIGCESPDAAAYLAPLLTGTGHSAAKHKVAWEVLARTASDVYKGDPRDMGMIPFSEVALRFRSWYAERAQKNPGVLAAIKDRLGRVQVLVSKFEQAESDDEVAKIKAQLLGAGEEVVALGMLSILERRIDMPEKHIEKTRTTGVGATELFMTLSGINLEAMRTDAFEKLKAKAGNDRTERKDNWKEAWATAWRGVIAEARAKYLEKARVCPYHTKYASKVFQRN